MRLRQGLIVGLASILFPTWASADPLFRMTLTGGMAFEVGPPCTVAVCYENGTVEIQVIIDEFTVRRSMNEDGEVTTSTSWHASDWSIVNATGALSLLSPFEPDASLAASGNSAITEPRFRGGCCGGYTLSYDDGVNSLVIDGLGDMNSLDPFYHAVALPHDALWSIYTPATGALMYFGNLHIAEIEPVPEPVTLVLVGGGLVGVAVQRRRKRRG